MDRLTEVTGRAALEQYGIAVVDVRIKRLNLPEQNKQSVYARMRAERERIARQYRAEGEEQALSIRADADRQKEEILSEAYREAENIKGHDDAEFTRIYGTGKVTGIATDVVAADGVADWSTGNWTRNQTESSSYERRAFHRAEAAFRSAPMSVTAIRHGSDDRFRHAWRVPF